MWRLQLFLLLSTCFLIPHEAKPAKSSIESGSTAPAGIRRTNNIGRLAAKDLADLLLASMQARDIKLTDLQESMVKSLRNMEPLESQTGTVMLQLGMDVIIDVLIGSNAENASCERVIKDITKSKDKNSLTLSLKSFLALCSFNNIECSQKQVVQIIKNTAAIRHNETAVEGTRSTRTALVQDSKSTNMKSDRDSIMEFVQARNLGELSAILSALLQVCGASNMEAQTIVQNLIEMGPKDKSNNNGISVLQVNGFSTLIISLMDSLTSIAEGNTSGFCAATSESWIVRLLNMGVDKVVIMGLLTALDRSLPNSPKSLTQQGNTVANLVDADVPLNKAAPTSKRSSGSLPVAGNLIGSQITTGPQNVVKGDGNTFTKLVDANVPVAANVLALNSLTGLVGGSGGGVGGILGGSSGSSPRNIGNVVGNTISSGRGNVVNGDGNTFTKLVDANVPVAANVLALNSLTGLVGGSNGGSSSGIVGGSSGSSLRSSNVGNLVGNKIKSGPENIVTGNGNTFTKLVDANVPVAANVLALNSLTGLVGSSNGGSSSGIVGGSSGSSLRSSNVGNLVGNKITSGRGNVVKGDGNTFTKLVDANVPVAANVLALNSLTGLVGGSSGGNSDGSSGGTSGGILGGGSGVGNLVGNKITSGPQNVVTGNGNTFTKLVDANVPVAANVLALNSLTGLVGGSGGGVGGILGGSSGSSSQNIGNVVGNTISSGRGNVVNGDGNTFTKLVDANVPVAANVLALNSLTGLVGGSNGGSSSGILGGTSGSSSGSRSSPSVGNLVGNKIISGPQNIVTGDGNTFTKLVDANIPVAANVLALNSLTGLVGGSNGGSSSSNSGGILGGGSGIGNLVGNKITSGPQNIVTGDGNTFTKLVDANVPVAANVLALNSLTGLVGGSSGGSSSGSSGGILGGGSGIGNLVSNKITSGPQNIVTGDGNTFTKLVDANVPVAANVLALNSLTGLVGGSGAGVGGILGESSGGSSGGILGGVVPVVTGLAGNVIGNTLGGVTSNIVGGTVNTLTGVVGATIPLVLNVLQLNQLLGSVTGGSSSGVGPVHVMDEQGNRLMSIADKPGSEGIGNDLTNNLNKGPRQIIMGNNNKIIKLVNLDADVLGRIDLANAIRGSSDACRGIGNRIGNDINTGPENIVEGNNNSIITLVDLNLAALLNVDILNNIIGTVGNDCLVEPPTQEPPTPEPPTPEPPTPEPPTPEPPTPEPPTPEPPTPEPPTPQPPTPYPPHPHYPPTSRPPTPNPNNCYRRYCRKWRTRPSYLCYKNCGGSYVHRP